MNLPSPIKYHIYQGQDLPAPHLYDYVLDGGGVVKRVQALHFEAWLRVAEGDIAGLPLLPEAPAPGNEWALWLIPPKIPARWLVRVLEHAQRAGDEQGMVLKPVEQMYHFHWEIKKWGDTVGWKVSVPKQRTSGNRVHYRGGNEASIVLDLHSHHRMDAFFSPTDDRDELGCRFYAVIGRIYRRPEIKLRLGLYGDFIEVPALSLFEGLGPFVEA